MTDGVRETIERYVESHPNAGVMQVLGGLCLAPEYQSVVEAVLNGADDVAIPDVEDDETTAPTVERGAWGDADFTTPETDVWPPAWESREFWMARQEKMPWAPWNSSWKWGNPENWETKGVVDEWVEMHPHVDGYVVLLESEDDPYTDDPDPYAFVDGDNVRDPETGDVHPVFVKLLDALGLTYADISTSGTGVHALYQGALPEDVKQAVFEIDADPWGANADPPTVEIYDGKHVCVVTGQHVPGTPLDIAEWDETALDAILDDYLDEEDRTVETHDTNEQRADLEDYEPTVTDADETTTNIRDIHAAIDRLRPSDLPLRTRQVGTESTGWEKWDPSTYRPSSSGDSLHSPPDSTVFYDQKTGRTFGLLALFACEQGIITKPWSDLSGSDWWRAVESARKAGAPIPRFEHPTGGNGNSDSGTNYVVETCTPPGLELEPFDREDRWDAFQNERYDEFRDQDTPHIWGDVAGSGKTTNAALGADQRDPNDHVVLTAMHRKAREFSLDDATPDGYYHLKGGEQKLHPHCMDADHADEECPEHGDTSDCPSMCPVYDLPRDHDLRRTYEALVEAVGPINAHIKLNLADENEHPWHDGECAWQQQYEEVESRSRVVGVHEYQLLKTLRDGRDVILDESPRLLETTRTVGVEGLTRMANRLYDLAELPFAPDGMKELAAFAERVRDTLVEDGPTDLSSIDPPQPSWLSYLDVKDPISGKGVKHILPGETLAKCKLEYNETTIQRMKNGEWNGEPLAMDELLAAGIEAGLPEDATRQAIAVPATLDVCPWCRADVDVDNGARVCSSDTCDWHEKHNTITREDGVRARITAWATERTAEIKTKRLPAPRNLPDDPLILDATATPEKVAALYGVPYDDVAVSGDAPVEANMNVTQVLDGQYHASTIKDSSRAQEKIQSTIDTAGQVYETPLFIAKQDLISLFDFPDHAEVLHYHATRGLNFEQCDAVFCIGAPHPKVEDLRRDAELLAMDRDDIDVGGLEYSTRRDAPNPPVYRKLYYEADDGTGRAVPTKHYSGLVSALFREQREKEIVQSIHRARPVLADADEPVDVFLLTNVPTTIPVDDVVTFEELADPIRALLPVPSGAVDLLEHAHAALEGDAPNGFRATDLVETVDGRVVNNKRGFHRLAQLYGMDVTYATVSRWVNELESVGLLEAEEYEQQRGVRYTVDVRTLTSALLVLSRNARLKVAAVRRFRALVEAADGALDWLPWAREATGLRGDRCDWGEGVIDPP